jgi:predicted DNA-binding transcriptional regulator AlpA
MSDVMTKSPKQRSQQIEASQKALRVKRANEARRPQPNWLRRESLSTPRETETPSAPERLRTSDRSQGPPWLLDRHQVCALANASYPTIWSRMRAGTFPRSRVVGGKSMWLLREIEEWMASLPVRRLKGDAE